MWAKVAEEMQVPWRAAEAMHWQLGENEMGRRAGVMFLLSLKEDSNGLQNPQRTSQTGGPAHLQSYGRPPDDFNPSLLGYLKGAPPPNPTADPTV